MSLLASTSDVEALLGRSLSTVEKAEVERYLSKASELFRLHSGQDFTPGRSEVERIVNAGVVYLPQRPVTEIHSVKTLDGDDVEYERRDSKLRVAAAHGQTLVVDYEHGGAVPTLVRDTVAEVGKKVFEVAPEAKSGVTQHSQTDGPFTDSYTYAQWALGGETSLSPADREVAESFMFNPPRLFVARA